MAEKNAAGTVSPVVVRKGQGDDAGRASQLESELAKVIKFMNQSGITAAGIGITGIWEVPLDRVYLSDYDRADAERLTSARSVIRKAAEDTIGLYALPDAILVLHNVGVTLLGDDRPGTLRESGKELIPAEEATDQ